MMALKCFAIMPFAKQFKTVYAKVRRAAQNAMPGELIDCHHLGEAKAAGKITDDIITSLREAAFCVADVTGNNPNVMWETGYAMALGKPTILIGRKIQQLPFDLRDHRILPYSPANFRGFGKELVTAIQQTLSKYDIKGKFPLPDPVKVDSLTIAVTGSMEADPAPARRRIETILKPYVGHEATWYCGSFGAVDEAVLEYLSGKRESVVAVGYNRFDLSEAARRLIQVRKIPFVDASIEGLPRGLNGPSQRDIFFCMKAELVVLFWNAGSTGTEALKLYFEQRGKNLLVGFI